MSLSTEPESHSCDLYFRDNGSTGSHDSHPLHVSVFVGIWVGVWADGGSHQHHL